jgi:tRNA nucleotidyltransferase/poly(A) polymerase
MQVERGNIAEFLAGYAGSMGTKIYMVGGALRDSLLKKPVSDMDFVLSENTEEFSKHAASQMEGSWVELDGENGIYRVVSGDAILDFCGIKGDDIGEDLSKRDFTINALALDLETGEYMDPFGGRADMDKKIIRHIGEDVFLKDPVRMLRAVRLSQKLGFTIDPGTERLIRSQAGEISRCAEERIMAELSHILNFPESWLAVRHMYSLNLLSRLLPGTEGRDKREIEGAFLVLKLFEDYASNVDNPEIDAHLKKELAHERTRCSNARLALLIYALNGGTIPYMKGISNAERVSIREIISAVRSLWEVCRSGDRTAMYGVFKRAGGSLIEAILISGLLNNGKPEEIQEILESAERYGEVCTENIVSPGRLKEMFGMEDREIGSMLERIRLLRFADDIDCEGQVLEYLEKDMKQ